MTPGSDHHSSRLEWAVLLAIAFVLAGLFSLWGPITTPLIDPFHEGEYLSTRMLFGPGMSAPLLIHGSMDYVPANLARLLFGADRMVAGTRLVNLVFTALACFAFLGALLTIARSRGERLAALLLGAAVLFWINARAPTVVLLQQGSPGVRDFPMLAALWTLVLASRQASPWRERLMGLSGLIAALGWGWAYNRGVFALALIPAFGLAAVLAGEPRRVLAWLGGGLVLGLGLDWVLEPGMWLQHFRNALYWQQNDDVWHVPTPLSVIARNLPFYALGLAVLAGGAWALWICWRNPARRAELPILTALGVVAGGSFLTIFSYPNPVHLMFTVPFLALLGFAVWLTVVPGGGNQSWYQVLRGQAGLLVGIAAVLIVDFSGLTGTGTTRPVVQGLGRNLIALAQGLPRDADILEPRAAKVAAALRAGGANCTYVFDNSGAFYHLSGLPSCSSVMLPAYLTARDEGQIIADLERRAPPLVVGRSSYWTDHIDDRSVAERTPGLNRWFEQHYVVAQVIDGVEIRRRK